MRSSGLPAMKGENDTGFAKADWPAPATFRGGPPYGYGGFVNFYIRKPRGGDNIWLCTTRPAIAWGSKDQAMSFTTKLDAIRALSVLSASERNTVLIVGARELAA